MRSPFVGHRDLQGIGKYEEMLGTAIHSWVILSVVSTYVMWLLSITGREEAELSRWSPNDG